MITEDLIAYIQAQLRKNVSKEIISLRLSKAGWHDDDIQEGLRKVIPPPPIEHTQPIQIKQSPTISVTTQAPEIKAPDPTILTQKEPPISDFIVPQAKEIQAPVFVPAPTNLPTGTNTSAVDQTTTTVKEVDENEPDFEYIPTNPGPVTYVVPQKNPPVINEKVTSPTLTPEPTLVKPTPQKVEEFIPKLIPKDRPLEMPIASPPTRAPVTTSNIPQGALISSYAEDLSNASLVHNVRPEKVHRIPTRSILIGVLILGVLGGVIFAFASGLVSFVKKDAKTVLLRAPINFALHNSYKSVTKATLSLPSISNITTGLVSGEAVASDDKDTISIQTEGMINQQNGSTTSLAYRTTFKSSITNESILVDMKYDGNNSFISIPNIDLILGPNAPKVPSVLIPKGKFGLIAPALPPYFANKINLIDVDKVLSKRIDPYANTEIGVAFKEFVDNSYVVERSPELIGLVPTYHYQINTDRKSTQKLFNTMISFFLANSSEDLKKSIEGGLATATIDSFDVWIGKRDNNIHQYRFSISMPLSKVIGLDDKGIAGSKVTLELTTTFSDFDIANKIVMPEGSVTVETFMKRIEDMKLQDTIIKIRPAAVSLFNSEKSFGKANPSGSCTEPSPGSLFSPNSHPKGSTTAVGNIASVMNNILIATNNAGSCYSTPTAWAVAFPLPSDPSSFFCVDSSDHARVTNIPLDSPFCM